MGSRGAEFDESLCFRLRIWRGRRPQAGPAETRQDHSQKQHLTASRLELCALVSGPTFEEPSLRTSGRRPRSSVRRLAEQAPQTPNRAACFVTIMLSLVSGPLPRNGDFAQRCGTGSCLWCVPCVGHDHAHACRLVLSPCAHLFLQPLARELVARLLSPLPAIRRGGAATKERLAPVRTVGSRPPHTPTNHHTAAPHTTHSHVTLDDTTVVVNLESQLRGTPSCLSIRRLGRVAEPERGRSQIIIGWNSPRGAWSWKALVPPAPLDSAEPNDDVQEPRSLSNMLSNFGVARTRQSAELAQVWPAPPKSGLADARKLLVGGCLFRQTRSACLEASAQRHVRTALELVAAHSAALGGGSTQPYPDYRSDVRWRKQYQCCCSLACLTPSGVTVRRLVSRC